MKHETIHYHEDRRGGGSARYRACPGHPVTLTTMASVSLGTPDQCIVAALEGTEGECATCRTRSWDALDADGNVPGCSDLACTGGCATGDGDHSPEDAEGDPDPDANLCICLACDLHYCITPDGQSCPRCVYLTRADDRASLRFLPAT